MQQLNIKFVVLVLLTLAFLFRTELTASETPMMKAVVAREYGKP
jgi:hypothetical protein